MDVEITVETTASPEETVEATDLIKEVIDIPRVGSGESGAHRTMHAVGPHVDDIANFSVLNAVKKLLTGTAVANHQPNTHLDALGIGLVSKFIHTTGGWTIHRHGFFHEHIDTSLNGIGKMHPAKSWWSGENGHISRIEAVDCLFITIEANELAVIRHLHLIFVASVQGIETPIQTVLVNICHGYQFGRAVGNRKGIGCRSSASATATYQGHLHCFTPLSVHMRQGHPGEGTGSRHLAGCLEKFTAIGLSRITLFGRFFHILLLSGHEFDTDCEELVKSIRRLDGLWQAIVHPKSCQR